MHACRLRPMAECESMVLEGNIKFVGGGRACRGELLRKGESGYRYELMGGGWFGLRVTIS